MVHGISHLGGHDFPQLIYRATLATIGRGNTRLTNRRSARVINLYQKGGEVYGQPQMGSLTPYRGSRSKNDSRKRKEKGKEMRVRVRNQKRKKS